MLLNLEHLVPAERPHAWLGSMRPSEACAGTVAKLGTAVSAVTHGRLKALHVRACLRAQGAWLVHGAVWQILVGIVCRDRPKAVHVRA